MRAIAAAFVSLGVLLSSAAAHSEPAGSWVTCWAASAQGPYPIGNALLQPDLHSAFPAPERGARDQSFRMIVSPDLWSRQTRIRLSNAFGTRPVTFGGVFVGLQSSSSAVVAGTNTPVTFNGATHITVAPGESVWSDTAVLSFSDPARFPELQGRRLAVSFSVVGESGPITWHAAGMTSSYVSAPGAGPRGSEVEEAAFPYATTSWFFLDAVDMKMPEKTQLIVALGDSITDGTSSTLNGDDRWPNVLSRRLHAKFGNRVAVVNAGIGGNRITGPSEYAPGKPFPGGPAAVQRLERDVVSLSGVTAVIWFEGINDFSKDGNASVESVARALEDGVALLRARIPGVRVIGGTVTTTLGNPGPAHGFAEQDMKRQSLNTFIRRSRLFDGVIDFDKAIADPRTGEMRAEFVPDSIGGPGDKLHPNRNGYLAMGYAVDLTLFTAAPPPEL